MPTDPDMEAIRARLVRLLAVHAERERLAVAGRRALIGALGGIDLPRIAVREVDLPPVARDVINPEQPLPPGTAFFAGGAAAVGGCVRFFAVVMSGVFVLPAFFSSQAPWYSLLTAIGAILSVVCLIIALSYGVALRSRAQRRWRYGLFLLPEGLLLRTHDHSTWLPRFLVRSVDRVGTRLVVAYDDPASGDIQTWPITVALSGTLAARLSAIRRWVGGERA